MLSQSLCNTFKKCNGGGLKNSQRSRWQLKSECFQKNKIFCSKPNLRFGEAHSVFIFVVLSSLAALFALFPAE